ARQQTPQPNIPTVTISLVDLLIIISASKINNMIPGALISVVGMIIASYAFNFSATYGIEILGPVPGGLPKLGLPDVKLTDLPPLLATALSIFFVILAQSAATSRAYAIHYTRSEEHTSELQSRENLVCRLLLEKKKKNTNISTAFY